MKRSANIVRSVLSAFVLLGATLVSRPAPAQELSQTAALASAKNLIASGKAAEAKAALERIVKAVPDSPEAQEAARLIDRIKSIDVLLDFSHEVSGPQHLFAFLRTTGFGITRCQAYLPSLRANLADYELIVLYQWETDIPWDDLEYMCLVEYVKGGGRLLLVSEPAGWMIRNATDSVRAYPILKLAARFGLKLNKELEELSLGKGKVFHYRNSTLLTEARVGSQRPEDRSELLAFFEKLLPYPKLEDSAHNAVIEPEIAFRQGRIAFRYPLTLKVRAEFVRKALPKAYAFYEDLFNGDLACAVQFDGVLKRAQAGVPGVPGEIGMDQTDVMIVYELARALCQAWIQPAKTRIVYPPWLDPPWGQIIATDLMRKLGFSGAFDGDQRARAACLQRVDPDLTKIDLSIPPPAPEPGPANSDARLAYFAKCEHVMRMLLKEHGVGTLGKWRDIVFLYCDAGRLASPLSTDETIRLLSLTVGKDLFPFFKSIGTSAKPLPLDFSEPDRLRKELGETTPGSPGK